MDDFNPGAGKSEKKGSNRLGYLYYEENNSENKNEDDGG